MRTTRIVILAIFFTATLFVLFRAVFAAATRSSHVVRPKPGSSRKSILGLVYYNPPFSLFQPNAAISLTDDNSTSFAARPAAFGPQLAAHGLSGQLWVGSGFAEDSLESHGELGCSDIPGWEGGASPQAMLKSSIKSVVPHHSPAESEPGASKKGSQSTPKEIESDNGTPKYPRSVDDGTDNYLHETVRSSLTRRDTSASSHADIQSMQESAEIEGKVVLLMRGGCGFLEKVMWAQRRGAIAVIVGDNQRGGPLVNMFARGEDAENVTIPSVFTARTTAQLLSSLTQPGSFIEDSIDEGGNPVLKVQKGVKSPTKKTAEKAKSATQSKAKPAITSSRLSSRATKESAAETKDDRGWLSRLLGLETSSRRASIESPSGHGKLEWVMVDEWDNENDRKISENIKGTKKRPHNPTKAVGDEFRIGVQDWRDPDLVHKSRSGEKGNTALSDSRKAEGKHTSKLAGKEAPSHVDVDLSEKSGKGRGLFTKMFGEDDPAEDSEIPAAEADDEKGEPPKHGEPTPEPHHGLWVTITPNSGTSPFFDTLLVLVVSPLVTLSVVYALLILRARIRRRRWRAPKSVVERLPVRTYHTVVATPSLSPQTSSPSNSSPTTPLLQHSPSRPRPRSRTTTGVPESDNLTVPIPSASIPTASSVSRQRVGNEHEKGSSGFSAEWRKYMGRQVECVVCLEEYVDGVSRVMSLPCGHEFHAECITPWLTTRRRTCPICKGDVVRSLAHSSRSMPQYEPYREDSDDDAAASSSLTSDVEQGVGQSASRNGQSSSRGDGWFGVFSQSLSNGWQRVPSRSPSPAPRRQTSGS